MKTLLFVTIASASLSLVACTAGDDVYVRDPSKSSATSSSASLECAIVPGMSVCALPMSSVPEAERGRVLDALQAVSDFAWLADSVATDLEAACRGIVTETSGALPATPSMSTPEQRLGIVCAAARDAIALAEPATLRIDVAPASCTEATPRDCSATATAAPPATCPAPPITVTASPGASTVTTAVGVALSHHYPALVASKARFEALAATTSRISGNADALALLPAECIVSSTKLMTDAPTRVQAAVSASSLVVDAVAAVSH